MMDVLPIICPHGILTTPCSNEIQSYILLQTSILEISLIGIFFCTMTSLRVRVCQICSQSAIRFQLSYRIMSLGARVLLTLVQMSSLIYLPFRVVSINTEKVYWLARMSSIWERLSGSIPSQLGQARRMGLLCLAPILDFIICLVRLQTLSSISYCIIAMPNQQQLPIFITNNSILFPHTITILLPSQSELPAQLLNEFKQKGIVATNNQTYLTPKSLKKYSISFDSNVQFSQKIQQLPSYHGIASGLLASAYSFNLKQIPPKPIKVSISSTTKDIGCILDLAGVLIRSRVLANGRGDKYGSPQYFVQQCIQFATNYNLQIKILRGKELKEQGLNLFHAVGRGSCMDPALINISYKGNPSSSKWVALIGKGVCFDSGGLDLKSAEYLKPMFLDKSGACSCLSAFEQIVKDKLQLNVTVTLGMVENFISGRSYRPADIIQSKKGFTVQIADTDAEGRLVLADSMTWTQQRFQLSHMVQLSTLTYSCIVALGKDKAGIFGNSPSFNELLKKTGEEVLELGWVLPLDETHHQLLFSHAADFLSDANETEPGASIAAAFLQKFVEQGVEWIHLDVGGTCIDLQQNKGTGFGARLLLALAHKMANK